jgi:formylglycine-generating enzyme required for sulfatase activity
VVHSAPFPVTNAQYVQFIDATGWPIPYSEDELFRSFNWDPHTRQYSEGIDDCPIVLVSWRDTHQYCSWLGARLSTEAG